MESSFATNFEKVRIHTGPSAARSARQLNAAAFTSGSDIVFGEEQYKPENQAGSFLIAHELAHVLQQRGRPLVLQRKPLDPKGEPSHSDQAGTGIQALPASPRLEVVLREDGNRWLASIDGIPIAEIAVDSKEVPLQIQLQSSGNEAHLTVRHYGGARLARVADPGATLRYSVDLREIDMRQSAPEHGRSAAPPMPGETDRGFTDVVIAGPGVLRWPDESVGELAITSPPPPGAFSEFEDQIRQHSNIISGVVLDPSGSGEIIGYRVPATTGVTRLVDREGSQVFLDEISIETPLIDPIDFVPTPGSVAKVGSGIAGRVALKAATKKAAVSGLKVPLGVIARMRGVSSALARRALRKGAAEAPGFVRTIGKAGLDHSFDRHAAQWFGRVVSRETHYAAWRQLVERVAASRKVFPWSLGTRDTIGHLGRVEGKYFVVQFFEDTGELASAFVPSGSQLREMLRLLGGAP